MNKIYLLILLLTLDVFSPAHAAREKLGEAEFLGARLGGEDIAIWLDELADKRPNSIAVFSVVIQEPLDDRFAVVLETEVFKSIRSRLSDIRLQICANCRKPRVEIVQDRIVITKGSPDLEALKKLGREANVESFLTLEVFRTSLSIMIVANLYQTGSGEMIASKTISVPVLSVAGAASQILLTVGAGFGIGGDPPEESNPPFAASLGILEELGFGKGGITLGGVVADGNGFLAYITPSLGFRNRFGKGSFLSLAQVGIGFGASSKATGVALRGDYRVFFGSFASVGAEAVAIVPLASKEKEALDAYIGLNIGFSLGR